MTVTDGKVTILQNYIDSQHIKSAADRYIDVTCPSTGEIIAKCPLSTKSDVDAAVNSAAIAFESWSTRTVKDRVQYLIRFHQLLVKHSDELANLIVLEHGKNKAEALASIAKGNETVEYAISMPLLVAGKYLEVSRGVSCRDVRIPLGVVTSIVPFNFPIMVPMWTLPIAIATGNTMILKPSEKVPMTMSRVMELLTEAGLPKGVVNLVHGAKETVNHIIDHPSVKAVTFVGTSAVAKSLSQKCNSLGKKCLALGGAKNHLVAVPDCNVEMTAQDVVNSYSGCCGQRCMAASVLLTVGQIPNLVDLIVKKSMALNAGSTARDIGPVIDQISKDKIINYIKEAEQAGAKILLDGREWSKKMQKGFWVGPTVILHSNKNDRALKDEIFGPVLSIYVCKDAAEVFEIENGNPYGNAACIYTSTGATADYYTKRFQAAMLGVNIGVPVPREPFSFGGMNQSKFGDSDITGDGGIEFFTLRQKITTKWLPPQDQSWLS